MGDKPNEDSYPDEVVPIICCTICVLFIIMIILLLLISNIYVSAFTLICVFEYISRLRSSTPQCTDYVYIRFFVYSHQANTDRLVFERKKAYDNTVKLYYDDTAALWRKFGSYNTLDSSVKHSKMSYPHSRWLLGMWGSAYIRLMEADLVGISTSNSTDEPNIILARASSNAFPYYSASPPNPIMPAGPGTRGMLDILKEFPHWKQVLKRDKLCFSVTSSINYARNSVDKIDFVRPVRNKEDLQRYSRLRFITKGKNGKYPVEEKETTYYFDSTTRTHYWRYMSGNTLLRFFAYDTGDTLHYK
ncbi:hypothetical protein V5799_020702, partial [Amblyomma americanum]